MQSAWQAQFSLFQVRPLPAVGALELLKHSPQFSNRQWLRMQRFQKISFLFHLLFFVCLQVYQTKINLQDLELRGVTIVFDWGKARRKLCEF